MTEKEKNELLKNALIRSKEKELSKIPAETQIEHTFSDGFEEKIRKITDERSNSESKTAKINNLGRRVAIIIICAMVALVCGTMVTVQSGKKGNTNFTYKIEKYKVCVDDKNGTTHYEMKELYDLPKIPDGYSDKKESINNISSETYIFKGKNGRIVFSQYTKGVMHTTLTIEKAKCEELVIGDIEVLKFYSEKNDIAVFLWYENDYAFCLQMTNSVGNGYINEVVGKLVKSK